MFLKVLKTIGIYFLYYLSGCFIEQSMLHFNIALRKTADLEMITAKSVGLMKLFVASQFGNALYSMICLLIGLLILILLKNKYKTYLSTLFIFVGFALSFIMLSLSGIMNY